MEGLLNDQNIFAIKYVKVMSILSKCMSNSEVLKWAIVDVSNKYAQDFVSLKYPSNKMLLGIIFKINLFFN